MLYRKLLYGLLTGVTTQGHCETAVSRAAGGWFAVVGLLTGIAVLSLPVLSSAELAMHFDEPDAVLASNDVVDIIEHNGGVWFATAEGVYYSLDSGRTLLRYDTSNGLVSNNLSAIYSFNDSRVWVASVTGFGDNAISDGLTYSDDMGQNWAQVNFGPHGLDIPYVWGANRTIYDITGHCDEGHLADTVVDWMFFTAFAGGLLASQDGGMSWRRIFPSPGDSINFVLFYSDTDTLSFRNQYFSCAVDTSHSDSLYAWFGTAGGLFQFVYSAPRSKLFSEQINAIVFCDGCIDPGGSYVFFGGNNGMTRGFTTGGPYISRFESDGLPGLFISAVIDFGGRLFAGTMDSAGGDIQRLAISDDRGDSYYEYSPTFLTGPNQKISDFVAIRGRIYMAAEEAGLYVSTDTGMNWNHIFVDSSDITHDNRRNVVHALNALDDTLRVGTDSGLVTLYLDPLGQIDSSRFYVFPEDDSSSAKVIRVRTHLYYDSSGVTYDSLAVWTINRPLTVSGTPCVFRSYEEDRLFFSMRNNEASNDIGFIGDSAILVGDDGLRFNRHGNNSWTTFQVSSGSDNLNQNNVLALAIRGDTIVMGSDNGFAVSHDRGETFDISRPHSDTLGADFVVNYASNVPGITGNFMPAVGVQYVEGERWARIWVSNRPTTSWEKAGISVGMVVGLDSLGVIVDYDQAVSFERLWAWAYRDNFAWNFAFNGDSVFAATDDGLLLNYGDTGLQWYNVPIVDTLGEQLVPPGTPIYAVEVIDSSLWVSAGGLIYSFDLTDMKVDFGFYIYENNPPSLAFTGEPGYEHDGLEPRTGTPATPFTFRITYSDPDGDPPLPGYPRVRLYRDNMYGPEEVTGSPFVMTEADAGSYTSGRIYTVEITGIEPNRWQYSEWYNYWFEARDYTGAEAASGVTHGHGPVVTEVGGDVLHVAVNGDDSTGDGSAGSPLATIMKALYLAANEDTILVHDGTYTGVFNRDLHFYGKSLVVMSENGAEQTIIDCQGDSIDPHIGISLWYQDSNTVISGFTIKQAYTHWPGSGWFSGGALILSHSSPTIVNCILEENQAHVGSALDCRGYSSPVIRNCAFIGNSADSVGGAIFCDSSAAPVLINCTFSDNSAPQGAALWLDASSPIIERSIIAFSTEGEAIACDGVAGNPTLNCTDIFGNAGGDWVGCIADQASLNGNISANPLFCDADANDYHLATGSPCAPDNNSCGVLIGAFGTGCTCCLNRGNVDHIIGPVGPIDIADIIYLITYLYANGDPPPCPEESNIDGITGSLGAIDFADAVYLVDYMFRSGPPPQPCQ